MGDRVDEVAEDVLRPAGRVAITESLGEKAIEAAGHAILDRHAVRIAVDEVGGGAVQLIGQLDHRRPMTEVGERAA